MSTASNQEVHNGYVVDIACVRKYPRNELLARAREHTKECALMGHCIESGYALIDDDGQIALLDAKATPGVVNALERSERGRGGWLNQLQNRSVWALFRATGRRADGTTCDRWLALAGPFLVVLTLVVWVALLVVGFALIYYPWIAAFLVSPGTLRTPWAETLYYSGYTAATLGFGDLIANHEALRLLAPVQAFLGFAMLSISVTYISSLYRNLLAMRTLAADVAGYFSAGTEPTLRTAATEQTQGFARRADGANTSLLHSIQAHMQYPILHYFRPSAAEDSLPVQLKHLLGMRRLVRGSVPPKTAGFAADLSVCSLTGSVERYLEMVNRYFIPAGFAAEASAEQQDKMERVHRRLLRYMCHH